MTRPINFLETAPWAHWQPQQPVRYRHRSSFRQEQRPESTTSLASQTPNGAVAESLENNNTRNSGFVYVGPDLTVSALTGPSSAVAGSSISVTVTTRNQGGDTAPVSVTRFYLSSNNSLDAGDALLGAREVSSLAPGLSEAGPALLPIPASTAAGAYYIIAKGDGDDAIEESQETNNLRSRAISIAATP